METTQQQSVIEELEQFIKRTGISQTKVMKSFSFSTATYISLRDGTWAGKDLKIKEKYLKEIRVFLDSEKERLEDEIGRARIPFHPTYNYKVFRETAAICEKYMEIGVVTGAPRFGKTRAAKKYKEDHPSTIYIELRRTFTTNILIRKLFEAVGGNGRVTKSGSQKIYPVLDDMVSFIVEKLKGSKRLLIFDQMEYASYKGIDTIRSIWDECLDANGNGTIGVLFTGLEDLIYQLKNFPQLHGRISWYRKLGVYQDENDDEIPRGMTDEDVEMFVLSVFPKATSKIINDFAEAGEYNPGYLKKILDRGLRLSEVNKLPLSKELILKACKSAKLP